MCNLVYYFHLKSFIPFHIFFLDKNNFFLFLVSWVSFCISSVISIHFLMELFVKICLKTKKNIFESLLKLFVKKDVVYYFPRRTIHYENPLLSEKVNRLHNY